MTPPVRTSRFHASQRRRSPGAFAGALFAVLLAGGCDFGFDDDDAPAPSNTCAGSGECPEGSTCQPDIGLCVAAPRRAYRVGLLVAPGSDRLGELPEQASGPFSVAEAEVRRDVTLTRALSVVGDVVQRPEPGAAPVHVPARLRFARPSAWPSAGPLERAATTSADPMDTGAGPADYRVRLQAGARYRLTVIPTGEAAERFPPLRFENIEVPAEGDVWRLDVVYGEGAGRGLRAPWPPRSLALRLAYEDTASGGFEPLAGLHVRAVDAESGRLVSSIAVSDAEGLVQLALSPDAGDVLLRVSAGEDRPLFPTITVPPVLLHPAETPLLLLPRPRPVRYVGRVEVAGRGTPVAEATVSFESDSVFDETTRLQGSFRATVRTAAGEEDETVAGRFDVVLLPGSYTVRIVPSDPTLAVAIQRLEVTPPDELRPLEGADGLDAPADCGRTARCGQLFEVFERSVLGGRILSWRGEPFAGVLVEGRALGLPLEGEGVQRAAAPFNRPSSVVSDGTGRFALPLDVGIYDVRLEPPADSGFAPLLWPGLRVEGPGRELRGEVELGPPTRLQGAVLGADGRPWEGATVRAYAFVVEGERQRPVFVGQAQTDAQGRYTVLLPTEPLELPELREAAGRGARLAQMRAGEDAAPAP